MEEDRNRRYSLNFVQKNYYFLSSQLSLIEQCCNLGTIAQGSKKNTYQLESKQFDYEMADSTRTAQIEEQICSLQTSQAKLKATSERHGKLLIEVLQCLQNLRTTESSTRKTSQAEHTSVEPGLWRYSICTNGDARATPFDFDRPSPDDSTLETQQP